MRERKLNRLKNYDYSQAGCYFVTICTQNHINHFGEIKNNGMTLNPIGNIAQKCWLEIPEHFLHVKLDEFIVMPNHIHGIIVIENMNDDKNVGNKNFCSLRTQPWQTKLSRSLSSIIRGFKIGVTKWCRNNKHDCFQWQRSFHDHIVRNENDLNRIRDYIKNNPVKWALDGNNPRNNAKLADKQDEEELKQLEGKIKNRAEG